MMGKITWNTLKEAAATRQAILEGQFVQDREQMAQGDAHGQSDSNAALDLVQMGQHIEGEGRSHSPENPPRADNPSPGAGDPDQQENSSPRRRRRSKGTKGSAAVGIGSLMMMPSVAEGRRLVAVCGTKKGAVLETTRLSCYPDACKMILFLIAA